MPVSLFDIILLLIVLVLELTKQMPLLFDVIMLLLIIL